MEETVHEMEQLLAEYQTCFSQVGEPESGVRPAPDDWSLKEILGHLIDSASNNHQRFVRLQLFVQMDFPDYQKDDWIDVEKFVLCPFSDLRDLFLSYNRLILHLVRNVDCEALNHRWNVLSEEREYITLEDLIRHYVSHLRTHLDHFRRRLEEVRAVKR